MLYGACFWTVVEFANDAEKDDARRVSCARRAGASGKRMPYQTGVRLVQETTRHPYNDGQDGAVANARDSVHGVSQKTCDAARGDEPEANGQGDHSECEARMHDGLGQYVNDDESDDERLHFTPFLFF